MKSLKDFASCQLKPTQLESVIGGGVDTTWTDTAGGSGEDYEFDNGVLVFDDGLVIRP